MIIQMRTTPVSCLSSIMVSGLKTAPSAPKTTTGVQLVSLFQSSNTKRKNAEEWCAEIVAQEIISSLPPTCDDVDFALPFDSSLHDIR